MPGAVMLSPEQRKQRARIAALTRWSNEDPKASAVRGQSGLRARIEREVAEKFPDLAPAELARRADVAYRLHFSRLAYASAKVRTGKAAQRAPRNRTDGGGPVAV